MRVICLDKTDLTMIEYYYKNIAVNGNSSCLHDIREPGRWLEARLIVTVNVRPGAIHYLSDK